MLWIPLVLSLVPCAPRGEPFAELDYPTALEQARTSGKLLLVDFTASWCGPCHRMEKDTWGHEGVRAWLAENALALQIDVDVDKELAARFEIEAMPTVVAFRDGALFDRAVGYRGPDDFLTWVRDVGAGKRSTDGLLERSRFLEAVEDLDARYDIAGKLQQAGMLDDALVHYLWVWTNSRNAPAWSGVRCSFLLRSLAELASKHAPAHEAAMALLVEAQARVDAPGTLAFVDWREWSSLCKYFEEGARIVAWYEHRRDADGRLFVGQTGAENGTIVASVFEALIDASRPRDAARLYEDGVARARELVARFERMLEALQGIEAENRDPMVALQRSSMVTGLATLHAALLLDGREAQATEVAELLLAQLDGPEARIGLVRAGIELVQQRRASFERWLDEAEAAGGSVKILRRKLQRLPAVPTGPDEPSAADR